MLTSEREAEALADVAVFVGGRYGCTQALQAILGLKGPGTAMSTVGECPEWQDRSMSQNFGIESPRVQDTSPLKRPVRYVVVIDAGGSMMARLFLETRETSGSFDAAVEELSGMIMGLVPQVGALGSEWDVALQGHSQSERTDARIYTLKV